MKKAFFTAVLLACVISVVGVVRALRPPHREPIPMTKEGTSVPMTGAAGEQRTSREIHGSDTASPSAPIATGSLVRTEPPTASEEREFYRSKMKASGRTSESWTHGVRTVLAARESAARQLGGINVSPLDCYKMGCYVAVEYENRRLFEAMNDAIAGDQIDRHSEAWNGTMFVSGPEQNPNGTVTNVWMFFNGKVPEML